MDLKSKTVFGMAWSFAEMFGIQLVSFVVQIVLARLIVPEAFGVVATLAILIQIVTTVIDGGFAAALIQKKEISRTDISTVFYFNVATSVVLFVVLIASAGAFSDYFKEPLLQEVIPWLGVGFVISSFAKSQQAMLTKKLLFKKLASISFPATIVGGVVGVSMAFAGFHVWALVFHRLSTQILMSGFVWLVTDKDIQPNFAFSFDSAKKLYGLSFGVLGGTLLGQISTNLAGLIIAKAFSFEQLGYYNRANAFYQMPVRSLVSVLNRVLFPVFSEIDDDRKLEKTLRRGIPAMMFCVAPLMVFLMASAESLVLLLLTDVWIESVQYMQLVPLIGIILALNGIKSNVIRARGNGKVIFLLSLFRNTSNIIVLMFCWQFGIIAIILGQLFSFSVNMLVNDYFIQRFINYRMKDQVADWLPYLLLSLVCGIFVWAIEWFGDLGPGTTLTIQIVVMATSYLLGIRILRLNGLNIVLGESKSQFQKILSKMKSKKSLGLENE